MTIGQIKGVSLGAMYPDRKTLSAAGVHRATQAGITGPAKQGAESIVLSGGYVDDVDDGDEIIYTGHGGRDQNTGRQVSDQEFTDQNQALVTSCLNGLPVRVVRGAQHRSPHSPLTGYRYDGLYFVESYWSERGKHGFLVCRFRLVRRLESVSDAAGAGRDEIRGAAKRVKSEILRIVRDSAIGRQVKGLYDYKCQICGQKLECVGGPYAEAAHIRPVGRPHDGPDELENLLCLCPNHHVLFDRGSIQVAADFTLIGTAGTLHIQKKHRISHDHLSYHRKLWER
jgi:putative restriction endonuclease